MLRRTPLRRSPMVRRFRSTGPDDIARAKIAKRDGGCAMCGAHTRDLQVHHRKPRKIGGRSDKEKSNSLANLLTLCADDHTWCESRRTEAYEMGFLVRESDDPAQVPVSHVLYGLVYLLEDGTVQPVPSVIDGNGA